MANTKETLQNNIETKTKELNVLNSKILAETEQIKKDTLREQQKKLEDEIKNLKKQLDSILVDVKNKTKNLKDEIDINIDQTYEFIKWSEMYHKLIEIGLTDAEIKEFAENIDKVVRKFLDQELKWFPNSIKNSMSVGIQFAMIETLTQQWADWSAEFFTAFSGTKTASWTSAFEWLYKAFGKLWSANKFYTLANKVQNITWYLSDKKSIINNSKSIPELMNPAKFKTLLEKSIRSNQKEIDKLDIKTILSIDSTIGIDLSNDEKKALKDIVNNDKIPITAKTIESIQKSLKTADKLLDTREKFQDKASDLVTTISGVLDINIPFFWNLGEMMGMKFPTDIFGEQKDWWVLNFVLWVLGFRGWLTWLHRKYIQEKLDDLHIDNTFVSAAFALYKKNIDSTITHDSATSVWKTCWLNAPDTTIENNMKTKIPTDYFGLKKSLVDNLDKATLNPTMVAKFAPEVITTESNKPVVDITKIKDNKDAFVDKYLKYIIPILADPNDKFIKSQNVRQDSFVLAVMWGLVGDKYFIEWVNIWLLSPIDFSSSMEIPSNTPLKTTSPTTPESSYIEINETDSELVRLSTWPKENYSTNPKFIQFLHTLEQKNGLAYGVMLNLMITESWGQLYRADGKTIIWSSVWAKWLFAFMPDTAKTYIKKLWYTEADYEKIYTNPIIWAKACAQFLKDRIDAWDNTVNILAHYNAWPWTLWWQKITEKNLHQLPKETQKYILKIWYDILRYSNKPPILTVAQKEDPSLLIANDALLAQFLTAVNTIPSPQETPTTPEVASTTKIEAKTIADVTWFGDSGMEGLYGAGLKNALHHRWYNTQALLAELSQPDQLQQLQKYTSCVIVTWYNDIAMKFSSDTTKKSLEAIITKLKPTQVILSTLFYCQDKNILSDAEVDRINEVIRKVALEQKCPLIDNFKEIKSSEIAYASDGMHLKNYTPIFNNIASHVTWSETTIPVA